MNRLLLCFLPIVVLLLACSDQQKPPASPESASAAEEAHEARAATPEAAPIPALPDLVAVAGKITVYFIDVSLGDAIYIRTPTGEDILIDGGDSANEVSAFLDALGESAIDVVVPSHAHADHIRGLVRVMQERQVGAVWTNGESYTTNVYQSLTAAITASGAVKQVAKPGDTFSLGQVRFTVLAPASLTANPNNNSLVLRMDCGASSFMFTSDAEIEAERLMVASSAGLDIDVLKLGHHGSRTSTSAQLLTATTPRLAVYVARQGNQYGHPHQETLQRLAAAGVPVTGTGAAGATVVVQTACDDEFSVSPQTANFATITAPAATTSL